MIDIFPYLFVLVLVLAILATIFWVIEIVVAFVFGVMDGFKSEREK